MGIIEIVIPLAVLALIGLLGSKFGQHKIVQMFIASPLAGMLTKWLQDMLREAVEEEVQKHIGEKAKEIEEKTDAKIQEPIEDRDQFASDVQSRIDGLSGGGGGDSDGPGPDDFID